MVIRQPMVSRATLQRRVDDLDILLAKLTGRPHDLDVLMTVLGKYADSITEAARAEDDQWAMESIDKVLRKHGLPPLQDNRAA